MPKNWDNLLIWITAVFGAIVVLFKTTGRILTPFSIDDHGRDVVARLERIEAQMYPNGGSSLYDRLQRLEMALARVDGQNATILSIITNFEK